MKILKAGLAGSLESSDCLVEIRPHPRLELEIKSIVMKQFGEAIKASVKEVLAQAGIDSALVKVSDKGALDSTIRARLNTAIERSSHV